MKELTELINQLEASSEDERMQKALAELMDNERFLKILRVISETLEKHGDTLGRHGKKLARLRKSLKRLSSSGGGSPYSGPHPLSSVTIPSEEEVERIKVLANRALVNIRQSAEADRLVFAKPVPPHDPPGAAKDNVQPLKVAAEHDD